MSPTGGRPLERDPQPAEFQPAQTEAHLREYWYVLLKRRWFILAVVTVTLGYFTVRAPRQKPVYTATLVLQIDRGQIKLVRDVMIRDWTGYLEFYPTQQRVLTSRTLAQRVVKQLRLWEHPYFGPPSEPTTERIEDLGGAVQGMARVGQIRNTQLMELSFTTLQPELSAELANALAHQFITFNGEKESSLARGTVNFIREQIEKIQTDIHEKEKLLREYSQREDLLMVDENELMVVRQLETMTSKVTQARAERAEAEAVYRSLRSAGPAALAEVQNDSTVSNLELEQLALQREVAELSSKFEPGWPELGHAEDALEQVSQGLASARADVAVKVISRARVDYESAMERERLLEAEAEAHKLEARQLGKLTTDYHQFKAEVDNQRSMLQQLLRRQSETGLNAELGEQHPINVRIVEMALVPKSPNGPGLKRSIMLGAVLGVGLALALAFFFDYWETTIYTIDDLRRHVPLQPGGLRAELLLQLPQLRLLRNVRRRGVRRDAVRVTGRPSPVSPDLSRTILSNLSGVSVDAHGEPQVENWDRFERTAHEERVAPLLHLALRQPDLFRSIPDDVRRSLRRSYWSTAARNVSLLGALDELGEKLESLGVLPVVLKGAVLAQEVYPSLALRPMDDVDLLVREDELPGTEAALSSLGFRVWAPEIAPGLTRSTKHARLYVNDRTAELAVDLHWSLVASENDRRSPPLSVFWQGVRRSASVGLRLSDTLHFLYLIGHLMLQHHNGRRRLLWWVDLHLMTRRGTIDWHEVRCRAGDFGWADTVGAALEELELRFPGSVPSDGRRAVMNDVTARSAPPRVQGERGFAELATLGWRGRLRLVVAHLFPAPGYVRHRYRLRSRWSWPLLYPVRWSTIAAKSAAWLVRAARGGVRRLMTEADTISTSS